MTQYESIAHGRAALRRGRGFRGALAAVAATLSLAGMAGVVTEPMPVAYKYYRFSITKVSGTEMIQIGEIALYDADGNRINLNLTNKGNVHNNDWVSRLDAPNTCTLLENGASGQETDGKHATQYFFDGSLDTKGGIWSLSKVSEDDESTWPGIIMRLADDAPAVAAYNLATGDDNAWAEYTAKNGRTVTGWTLDGSADGHTWVRLDRKAGPSSAVPSPITNKTWYNGGVAMALTDYSGVSYFVGAGDTLRIPRAVGIESVINGGTLEIAGGATARWDVASVDAIRVPGGALAGSGTLEKRGAGDLRIGGDNSAFAGLVAARGGTIRFVETAAPKAYAYYRLMLRKKNGGNTTDQFELGEIALYDVAGNRLNLNLTNKGNSGAAGDLTAGSFTFFENGAWASGAGGNEAPEKLFDGDLGSKMYSGGFKPTDTKCPYVLMRLADDAPAVAAYRIGAGNDIEGCPNRHLVSWSLEGSSDGTLWTTLDAVSDDPRSRRNNKSWFNGGRAYPAMAELGHRAKYYRFSITALYACAGYDGLQMSELALYDAHGNRLNLNLEDKGDYQDLATLTPGSFTYNRNGHARGGENEQPGKIFDGDTTTKGYFCGSDYSEGKSAQFVMRLADDAAPVAGYNICSGNDDEWAWGAGRCRTPGSWTLEASDDGTTWTLLASETDSTRVVIANTTWFGQGTAFSCLSGGNGGSGAAMPKAATLSVSDGATLVLPANQQGGVTHLEIDCAAAPGTIENFTAAEGMTLNLIGFRAFRATFEGEGGKALPIAFSGKVDLTNLGSCRIFGDGRALSGYTLSYADGALVLSGRQGFVLLLQ